jgi:hypothetical protein
MNEFKMTANPIYVILFLELIVILMYIYLPEIFKKISLSNGVVLLPKSSFLNIKQVISSNDINEIKVPKEKDENLNIRSVFNGKTTLTNWIKLNIQSFSEDPNYTIDKKVFNQNYAFSMWIYINSQTLSVKSESEIFNFGHDNSDTSISRTGKPRITYFNDITSKNNKNGKDSEDLIRVYFTNQTNPKGYYDFKIVKQKWNNIVLNITAGKADLFVNGNIEFTYYYVNNQPIHEIVDFITVGQDNGVNGAICNVVYYPKNLSLVEITNNYNLLMLKNPPIQ